MTEHLTICTIGVTGITIIVTYLIQLHKHKLSANVNLTMVLFIISKRWVNVSCESLTHYHSVPSCTMKGGNTHTITQFVVSTRYKLTRT